MIRWLATAALVVAEPAAAREVRIVGYNDMAQMLRPIATRVQAAHPDLHIVLDLRSTRSGPPALLDGSALLAPMGAAIEPEDVAAIRARWGAAPLCLRIAHDSLTPGALSSPTGAIVAADNPVRRIALKQLRALFVAGTIRQWGELGAKGDWASRPVHPVSLGSGTAIGRFLLRGPLTGTDFAAGVRTFGQSRDVVAAVAADPLALGLANLNHGDGRAHAIDVLDEKGHRHGADRAAIRSGRYPLDRVLSVCTRRDATGAIDPDARLILGAMLSDAGQATIGEGALGYIPLNRRERAAEHQKLLEKSVL